MRAALRSLIPGIILLIGLPAPAAADWHLTPFIGWTFLGDTSIVEVEPGATGKVHWNFGGAVTLIGNGPLGVECLIVYTPKFFDTDDASLVVASHTFALMGNVVIAAPRSWNEYGLRPFVSGGIGLHRASVTDLVDAFPVSENLLGYNVGGGAVGFITDRTGLRFELRYFSNLKPGDETTVAFGRVRLKYWTASVGVVIKF